MTTFRDNMKPLLLVIDDEPNIAYTIEETLGDATLRVKSALSARAGIEAVRVERPDVILLDIRLPDMSGLDAFLKIREIEPRTPVIMMTAFAKTETAIEATRRGAFDYFVKPIALNTLRQAVKRALDTSRLSLIPAVVDDQEEADTDHIVGRSVAMQEVYKAVGRVARQDVTVLILGESGTGKELAARAVYHYSRRAHQPFLAVNCAALTESLLESELFGHEKGAFTGADQRRIGKFEQVNGGTIFLDEIGDMSPATQAKALRLLQQQQFERVGGTTTIQTDVRIIAATNKDLAALVAAGKFREDLYYRLSGFILRLPPLRERMEDIPQLTDYLLRGLGREWQKPIRGVTDEVRDILQRHSWPGNVRELANALRYAVVQSTGDIITSDCLPETCLHGEEDRSPPSVAIQPGVSRLPDVQRIVAGLIASGSNDIYREVGRIVDQTILAEVLSATNNNQVQAAERLGVSRMTLRSKLKAQRDSE